LARLILPLLDALAIEQRRVQQFHAARKSPHVADYPTLCVSLNACINRSAVLLKGSHHAHQIIVELSVDEEQLRRASQKN